MAVGSRLVVRKMLTACSPTPPARTAEVERYRGPSNSDQPACDGAVVVMHSTLKSRVDSRSRGRCDVFGSEGPAVGGEVSRRTGVALSARHFYERLGLISLTRTRTHRMHRVRVSVDEGVLFAHPRRRTRLGGFEFEPALNDDGSVRGIRGGVRIRGRRGPIVSTDSCSGRPGTARPKQRRESGVGVLDFGFDRTMAGRTGLGRVGSGHTFIVGRLTGGTAKITPPPRGSASPSRPDRGYRESPPELCS